MSSHFRRKHFKNTLNTCLLFCWLVSMPEPNLSVFFINLREGTKNVKIRKSLIFRQLCGQLRQISKTLQMFFQKRLLDRIQLMLKNENARTVYHKHINISKAKNLLLDFSIISNRSEESQALL